ncbi:winged helix-turn-helix domain-containing protein [Devriesea agamarum]|uniref:winged helix-turn-helix domain-containing protein n=1 Tax=Devriesea agamarum TaxID=472569 RepID=UPI00071E2140|nr:crosslink repair DNA glycosylase YcaQ family protein [Devriesea agamarum]
MSWRDARRVVLRSLGFGRRRPLEPLGPAASRNALARTVQRLHLLQIDSIQVFARAHHLPVYSRYGGWDVKSLDRAARPGPGHILTEAMAHEACYVTHEVYDLLASRRARVADTDWSQVRQAAEQGVLLDDILALIRERGPMTAPAVSKAFGSIRSESGWGWSRTSVQWAVEYLFRSGRLGCVGRTAQFERLFEPVERAFPQHLLNTWKQPDAEYKARDAHQLVDKAARALGVASTASLADYFRLPRTETAEIVEDLRACGIVRPVDVLTPHGPLRMWRHAQAPGSSPVRGSTLVSPFDPLVFHRPRLRELFDVEYRIEIYTPAHKRQYGYYALPFLVDDVICARVDLKADRRQGVLRVLGAHREPLPQLSRTRGGVPSSQQIIRELADELQRAARWQGLERIDVTTSGPLAGNLAQDLARVLA